MARFLLLAIFFAVGKATPVAGQRGGGGGGGLRKKKQRSLTTQDTTTTTTTTTNAERIFKCPEYIPFEGRIDVGHVDALAVSEASGLVASVKNPGILFTHNDFGHGSVVIASRENGTIASEFLLEGAGSVDYEDIAAGPGPIDGEHYLYIGDIGDGKRNRQNIVIYRIREPEVEEENAAADAASNDSTSITEWDALTLTYPGRPHNAESLMLDPLTGILYIISRTDGSIWRTQNVWGEGDATMNLVKAGSKKSQAGRPATGADISRDGREILVKHYSSILYYCREPGEDVGEVLSTRQGVKVPYQREIKGEAVAFAAQRELGYYTLSESGGAVNDVPLYRYNRVPGR